MTDLEAIAKYVVNELDWPARAPNVRPPSALVRAIAEYIWSKRWLRAVWGIPDPFDTFDSFLAYIQEWNF